ncbi:MAG: DUF4332 domain-containing protein [Anaerolineales bacterium]
MGQITGLACLDSAEAGKLVSFGVTSTDRLLLVAAHKQGREDLARETNLDEDKILYIVHLADMMRVQGIGTEYSSLLEQAGVQTLKQLSRRSPSRLFDDIKELNSDERVVRRLPSEDDLEHWIDEAKELDSLIRY